MNNQINILKYVAILSFFGVTGFTFGALNSSSGQEPINTQQAAAASALTARTYDTSTIFLTAKAAQIFDISEGKSIYSKNVEVQLPLASLTKIALALLAYEHLPMDSTITISASAIATEGESGFTAGEQWRTQDLLDFTLMTSSNDGAVVLGEAIARITGSSITSLLNAQAQSLNLTQTYFVNETGLDSSTLFSGTNGSAQNMSTLFAYAYITAPEIFAATAVDEYTFYNLAGIEYEAKNTNKALRNLPGLVFGKTGFTDLAGGNLVAVVEPEPGHPFVLVVLGSTVEDRFIDIVTLARSILGKLTQQ